MSFNPLNFILARGITNELATILMPTIHTYGSADDTLTTISTANYFDSLIPSFDLPPVPHVSGGINDNYIQVGDFIFARDSTETSTFLLITQVTPHVLTTLNAVDIPPGSIGTAQLADGAVTTAKLANLAVTAAKIANNTITATQIANNTITGTQIQNASIGTTQLVSASVTNPILSVNSVGITNLTSSVYNTALLTGSFSGPWASPQSVNVMATRVGNVVTLKSIAGVSATATTATIATYSVALPTDFRPLTSSTLGDVITVIDNGTSGAGVLSVDTGGIITVGSGFVGGNFAGTGSTGFNILSITYLV